MPMEQARLRLGPAAAHDAFAGCECPTWCTNTESHPAAGIPRLRMPMIRAMGVRRQIPAGMSPPGHKYGKPAGQLWRIWRAPRPLGALSPSWLSSSVAMPTAMWSPFKPPRAQSVLLRQITSSHGAGARHPLLHLSCTLKQQDAFCWWIQVKSHGARRVYADL